MSRYSIASIIIFFLFSTAFSQENREPRITFFATLSFENTHSISTGSNNYDFELNANYLLGGEIILFNHNSFDKYGFGINYQANNNLIGVEGNYNFWPIYIFSQIKIAEIDHFKVNAQFSIGYNFFNASESYKDSLGTTKGGLYYSFGSVIYIGRSFQVRTFFTTNYGTLEISKNKYLVKNDFYSVGLGYSF